MWPVQVRAGKGEVSETEERRERIGDGGPSAEGRASAHTVPLGRWSRGFVYLTLR